MIGLEALRGKTVVVKYGGHAMTGTGTWALDVLTLRAAGANPVIVHGGGPQVTEMLGRLGISAPFAGGLRVTTPEAMAVVQMVLCGQVGPSVVAALNREQPVAVGLSGADGGLLTARPRDPALGRVADIAAVEPALIHQLLAAGRIPVIASVAPDADGVPHNVNADSVAGAVAAALGAHRLVMLTDVAGVYRHWPHDSTLLARVTAAQLAALAQRLTDGMVPKVDACLFAVRAGVPSAHIVDGRVARATLHAVTGRPGFGTTVVPA
jgi:acetylglutamate kinase